MFIGCVLLGFQSSFILPITSDTHQTPSTSNFTPLSICNSEKFSTKPFTYNLKAFHGIPRPCYPQVLSYIFSSLLSSNLRHFLQPAANKATETAAQKTNTCKQSEQEESEDQILEPRTLLARTAWSSSINQERKRPTQFLLAGSVENCHC